jgi:hypothetical protein
MIGSGGQPFAIVGGQNGSTPGLSGSQVDLVPAGAVHTGLALNYQTPVNVQSFSSTFTFIPNGWNVAFVINNSTRDGGGKSFAAGAGCEGGFFQGFDTAPPNNVFALELDSQSPLTENGSFTYSSVQIYQSGESPCLPNLGGTDFTYVPIDKVSTSPVNLTTGSALTTTGDVYSATVTYDGSNLTISLYDVTAGGSCPGATCFTKSWSGINIPSIIGSSNTAWVGLTAGTNQSVPNALYVDSFSYSLSGNSSPGSPGNSLARTHDFNGDGMSDITWRNTSTGDIDIWLMNGLQILASSDLGNVSTVWSVVGTGDFNGDGKSDILWRDTNGDVYIWLMNGFQLISGADLGNVPLVWSIAGVGDFNGDGTSDILWRNTSTGDVDVWLMNGVQIISTTDTENVSLNWSIAGTGDFNGDGKADILWRNSNGDVGIWLMNGLSVLSQANLGNVPVSWSITMTGDFNGDGKSDIAWRNTNGDVAIWLMNGLQILSATDIGNVPTAWTIQGSNVD